jgi:transcriptional regulator GlxA family with amidase domain
VVVVLALPGVQLLDVSGPLDVFAEANAQLGREVYQLFVAGQKPGSIRSSSGVRLVPDRIIGRDGDERLDTLLVAGRPNAAHDPVEAEVVEWLRHHAPRARRYGSVCSGAFFLAEAGLLKGRRVTTHWAVASQLRERYPDITVDEDAIFVREGPLRTAAGVTAGLDLALALIEEDLGRELAIRVASQLVMYFRRPGGQLQFSRNAEAAPAGRSALQEVQRWVTAHLPLDHSVARLAKRVGLSPRHFSRLFRQEIGMTPAVWVEQVRVSAARRLLERENQSPKRVAASCGFSDPDTLRRVFVRNVGVTPAEYRKRFASVRD